MNLHDTMRQMGAHAVLAADKLAVLSARKKNAILHAMADEIETRHTLIKDANRRDIETAKAAQVPAALIDRLLLTDTRITDMAKSLHDVAGLKDPIGTTISHWLRPNGLEIRKIRVPIGVIAIMYESRPNVTADAAALCFKTANPVILRGGKEAVASNGAIVEALQCGGHKRGLPEHSVQFVQNTDHDAIRELAQMDDYLDLIIPRGGEKLIRTITEHARVPVIKHYKGVCHTYVDNSADQDMALAIVENAKCQRPGVCNAMETLLVHKAIATEFLPKVAERLQPYEVEFRGDHATRRILAGSTPATEDDWYAEYLDLVLAVKVVPSLKAAIAHINKYGSQHSDAIVASSETTQKTFVQQVNSATVYVNASTRFTDGGEFGMGAEIGISTDKIHARGPMGLEELTTYKYVIHGKGQTRE